MRPDKIILLSVLVSFASYLLTFIAKSVSIRKKILDIPNERSSHDVPTPRGGGIAIVLSWYLGLSILFLSNHLNKDLYFALMSGFILASVSLADDVFNLNPLFRLVVQTCTAVLALFFLGGIRTDAFFDFIKIPDVVIYPVLIVGMVWFINLYNFLDGIDGYASIEAIFMSIAFFVFTGDSLNIFLAASVLGFLIWNWPKAKIFMGDVGSTQLGFILVVLGFYYHNQTSLSIIWWIVLSSPFWFDASLTLFRRLRNHEKLSQAHRKHIYQRLVQSGFSHLQVDSMLLTINVVLFLIVLFLKQYEFLKLPVLIFTLFLLFMAALYTDKRKPFPTDKL